MIKKMQQLKGLTKRPTFWMQGVTILSILAVLQAYSCPTKSIMPSKNAADWKIENLDITNFRAQTKNLDLSETIQNKKGKPERSWVYAAVRAENEEKLKYIVDWINTAVETGKCSNPNILNVSDASSGKTPLFRAVETNNEKIVGVLVNSKNIKVDAVDNKKRTALHMAAIYNKDKVFNPIWEAIINKEGKEKAIKCLFQEDAKGHSVFASAYLSDGQFGWFSRTEPHFKMFKSILDVTRSHLQKSDLEKIHAEIDQLKANKALSNKYADKLKKEINSKKKSA